MQSIKIKPITRERVDAVVQIAMSHYGWPVEFAPQVSMTDEFGWADEKSPIIMWEEGPDGFGYEFTQNPEARAYLAEAGFHMEAATSWAVVIYPTDGTVQSEADGESDRPVEIGTCGNLRHDDKSHARTLTCCYFIAD